MANEKLSLSDEEIVIFENALDDAYMAGKADVFVVIGPRESHEARLNVINEILHKYCETKKDLKKE